VPQLRASSLRKCYYRGGEVHVYFSGAGAAACTSPARNAPLVTCARRPSLSAADTQIPKTFRFKIDFGPLKLSLQSSMVACHHLVTTELNARSQPPIPVHGMDSQDRVTAIWKLESGIFGPDSSFQIAIRTGLTPESHGVG